MMGTNNREFSREALNKPAAPRDAVTRGEIESAERRALNLLDDWLIVSGVVDKHTGYYYELQGVIEDAVHCGIQQALGIRQSLPSQMTGTWISYTGKPNENT